MGVSSQAGGQQGPRGGHAGEARPDPTPPVASRWQVFLSFALWACWLVFLASIALG